MLPAAQDKPWKQALDKDNRNHRVWNTGKLNQQKIIPCDNLFPLNKPSFLNQRLTGLCQMHFRCMPNHGIQNRPEG